MMQSLLKIKEGIIVISKIIGIVICIYYIYKVNEYQVSWNLLSIWMMPTWLAYINSFLSKLGTYILILPLSIIIVSLLIKSTTLNIIACLFGISGGIVSLTLSMARGTLLEYTNFKVFVIYHAMALESKREVFINEYKTAMISISKGIESKLAYLTEHLEEKYFIEYDETLKKLPATEIKTYANRIVNELLMNLEKNTPGIFKRIVTNVWEGLTIQNIAITIGVVGLCFGGYKLISWLVSDNELAKVGANIQKETVSVAAESTGIQTATLETSKEITVVLKEMLLNTIQSILGILKKQDTRLTTLEKSNQDLVISVTLLHAMLKKFLEEHATLGTNVDKLLKFSKSLKKDD